MKISMLGCLPPIKGISPYILGLVKGLSTECEVDFYGFKSIYPEKLYPGGTKTNEQEPKIKNVHIHNYLTWYNPFSWIRTGFFIKTKVIHAQWWSWVLSPVYLTVLSIARLRGKKVIITLHNVKPHEKSFIKNLLNKSVIGLANEYIVHSEDNKKMFVELTKTKKKVHIIPMGAIKIKKSKKSKEELRLKYDISENDKILLFFGAIRDYKGLDVLLESLSKLKDDKIKLIVAGKPWNNFENYKILINKYKIKKRVKLFLEYINDEKLAELFKICDLAVLPYKEFEASSAVGAVALNFEKPLIVTNVGGLPDLVIDKNVIAKINDPTDLKDKIEYGLKNLKKLEIDSSKKLKEFSWNSLAKKTIEVYK